MRKVLVGLSMLVGLGALALEACSSTPAAPVADAGTDSTVAQEVITIGVSLALTGTGAPFGQPAQQGTRVAQQQVNSLGGVLGKKVVFEIVDDRTESATAKTTLEGFFGRKIPIALGPSTSGQARDAQDAARAFGFPLISPSASTPVTTEAEPANDRYFFRTAPSHAVQARAIATRLFRGFRDASSGDGGAAVQCKKVAVISQDDAYGNPIAEGIAATMKALGGSETTIIKVGVAPAASYDEQVTTLLNAAPECQVVVAFPAISTGYMRSFRKMTATNTSRDWSTFVSMGSNVLKNADAIVASRENPADPQSPSSIEGMYVMNFDLSPKTAQANEFKNVFDVTIGTDPKADLPSYAANQYDAAILALLAIQRAGDTTDGKKIRDALFEVSRPPGTAFSPAKLAGALVALRAGEDIDYDGASGPVDFDAFGEVKANFVVFRIRGGSFVELKEAGLTPADLD